MVLAALARGSLGSKRLPAPRPYPVSNELCRFLNNLSGFKVASELEEVRLTIRSNGRSASQPATEINRYIDNMYACAYNCQVRFEWDSFKAASNLQKHSVDFADATAVLDDDLAITIREHASGEERFVTLGMDALNRLLVVVYTWRGDNIRILSARKATPRERYQYES